MSKKLNVIVEFIKKYKNASIGIAFALGVAVIWVTGYALTNYFNSEYEMHNNLALSEKNNDNLPNLDNKKILLKKKLKTVM